jgi:hypothetical protein
MGAGGGGRHACVRPPDRPTVRPDRRNDRRTFSDKAARAAHTRTLLVGPETSKTPLFHVLDDNVMDLSVFIARRAAL